MGLLKNSSEKLILVLMTLTAFFWAGAFIAGKVAIKEFPAMTLTFYRFLIASAVIFPYLIKTEEKWMPDKKDIPLLFGLGFLGISAYSALFFTALKYTSASNAAMINGLIPITSGILASYFISEKITTKRAGIILLAFSGVMLTITGGDITVITNLNFNKGDLIQFAAMVSTASYGVLSKNATRKYSPLLVISYAFLFGTIMLIPVVLWENRLIASLSYSRMAWGAVFFMAIFSSVIGYLIQQVSIQRLGVNKTQLFYNMVPVFSILLSYIFLGEPVTSVKVLSVAIIITAVILNSRE